MIKRAACLVTSSAVSRQQAAEPPAFTSVQPDCSLRPMRFRVRLRISTATATWTLPSRSRAARFASIAMMRILFVEAGAQARTSRRRAGSQGLELGRLRWRRRSRPARRLVGRRGRAGPQPAVSQRRRAAFVEVAADLGMIVPDADSRQANWVDYDNDGDLDLFSAQRSGTNRLFRNDGGKLRGRQRGARPCRSAPDRRLMLVRHGPGR